MNGLNKKNKLAGLLVLAGVIFIGLLLVGLNRKKLSSRSNSNTEETVRENGKLRLDSNKTLDASHFFNDRLFYPAIGTAQNLNSKSKSKIRAVVVPHHLVGSQLIADAFKRAERSFSPEQIIILGPNHFEAGRANVITTDANWQTEFGILAAATQTYSKINDSGLELENNQPVFENEHAVGNLVHFSKYYFPEASLLPVILSSQTEFGQIELLSQQLDQFDLSQTLIIASIDFCHDIGLSQAFKNHQTVLELVEDKDYDSLLRLKNDHLDSGPSLVTLLLLAEKNNWQLAVIDEAHSSQFLDQPGHEGTSYMELIFSELNSD